MSAGMGSLASPADEAEAVTPSDTVNLTATSRALYVGVGGDVTAVMKTTGGAQLFKNVPSGTILPIRVTRVNNTGTTATTIVALY